MRFSKSNQGNFDIAMLSSQNERPTGSWTTVGVMILAIVLAVLVDVAIGGTAGLIGWAVVFIVAEAVLLHMVGHQRGE